MLVIHVHKGPKYPNVAFASAACSCHTAYACGLSESAHATAGNPSTAFGYCGKPRFVMYAGRHSDAVKLLLKATGAAVPNTWLSSEASRSSKSSHVDESYIGPSVSPISTE